MESETKTTVAVKIWVLLGADGEYEIGTTEDDVNEQWDSNNGTTGGNRRMVRLTLTVPLPRPLELTAAVPDDVPAGPVELKIEAA